MMNNLTPAQHILVVKTYYQNESSVQTGRKLRVFGRNHVPIISGVCTPQRHPDIGIP